MLTYLKVLELAKRLDEALEGYHVRAAWTYGLRAMRETIENRFYEHEQEESRVHRILLSDPEKCRLWARFADLPPELRSMIYEHAAPRAQPLFLNGFMPEDWMTLRNPDMREIGVRFFRNNQFLAVVPCPKQCDQLAKSCGSGLRRIKPASSMLFNRETIRYLVALDLLDVPLLSSVELWFLVDIINFGPKCNRFSLPLWNLVYKGKKAVISHTSCPFCVDGEYGSHVRPFGVDLEHHAIPPRRSAPLKESHDLHDKALDHLNESSGTNRFHHAGATIADIDKIVRMIHHGFATKSPHFSTTSVEEELRIQQKYHKDARKCVKYIHRWEDDQRKAVSADAQWHHNTESSKAPSQSSPP